jgi:hypothetical protein
VQLSCEGKLPEPDPGIANRVRQLDAYVQNTSIGEAELQTQSDARPSSFPFCP